MLSFFMSISGSSPLTRGKPDPVPRRLDGRRLIPAHAGKTRRRCRGHVESPAHPRSRGENLEVDFLKIGGLGSSPLTRGKPSLAPTAAAAAGLIPAHAGKTLSDLRFYQADRSDLGKP